MLLEGPITKLKVCENLNPATFLPEKENETPDHDCSQFLTLNYAAREDLKDTPLDNPDMEIFTDGSSFVQDGKRKAGYAVVTAEQVLEAKSLPQGTSAQLGACGSDPSSRVKQRAADGPDNLCESTSADSKNPESAV